jgi:hypothetical protein
VAVEPSSATSIASTTTARAPHGSPERIDEQVAVEPRPVFSAIVILAGLVLETGTGLAFPADPALCACMRHRAHRQRATADDPVASTQHVRWSQLCRRRPRSAQIGAASIPSRRRPKRSRRSGGLR